MLIFVELRYSRLDIQDVRKEEVYSPASLSLGGNSNLKSLNLWITVILVHKSIISHVRNFVTIVFVQLGTEHNKQYFCSKIIFRIIATTTFAGPV